MASRRSRSVKARKKRLPKETGKESPEMQESEESKPALSQEDLVRILKIIKKYSQ